MSVRSRYLVGCDGGRSTIRRAMGVALAGDAEIGRNRSTLVRCPGIRDLFGRRRPAWMSWVVNDRVRGNVVAIDGDELWLLHRGVPGRAASFEDVDFDQSIRDLLGDCGDLTWEVVNHEDWTGRRLVAERFRDGNVFIAGDAAHLWVPFAGYGMNAGIADGVHVAWLVAAAVHGWAGDSMLAAYEAERQPITDQVSRLAIAKVLENSNVTGGAVPPELSDPGPEGAALRDALGPVLLAINVPQFAPVGLNFGYWYDASPIISYDGAAPPPYTMGEITPSTVPGCRMPHFEVDGRPVLDLLGTDYTLVRFAPAAEVAPLVAAAAEAGMPLAVLDATRPEEPDVFTHDLLLVRYDQHVAWRGDRLPDDATELVDRLRGAA